MNAWGQWGIALACVMVWVWIGLRWFAPAYIIRAVENHIRDYPSSAREPGEIASWRREAAMESLFVALVWPVTFLRHLVTRMDKQAGLTRYELEKRIEELEREAGIR